MGSPAEVSRENGRKGGRPKSPPSIFSRVRAHELIQLGKSPIDVMINNMLFWFEHSQVLTEELRTKIVNADDPVALEELNKTLKNMLYARENAQKCAVDAAPYCHPKLASIEMTTPPPQPAVRAVQEKLTAKDAALQYAAHLRGEKVGV